MKVLRETERLAGEERGDKALFVVCVEGWGCCGSGFRADGTRWYPTAPDGTRLYPMVHPSYSEVFRTFVFRRSISFSVQFA